MSAPSRSGSAHSRKRRLDIDQERAQSPSRVSSTPAGGQDGNPPASFPQFPVPRGSPSPPQQQEEQHQRQQHNDEPQPRRIINPPEHDDADHDPYGDADFDLEAADMPSDTMATILLLQKEFYGATGAGGEGGSARAGRGGGKRTGVVLQHQMWVS